MDDHPKTASCNGFEVCSTDTFNSMDGERFFNIAIADSQVREAIATKLLASGARPFNIVADNSVDLGYSETGEGAIQQGAPGRPIVIGKGAVVGMGAVVTKSVAPGTTVVGNPARPLVK